jgi:hypothetical protein
VARVTGLWVYQTLGQRPNPETVAERAKGHGIKWLTAQAIEGEEVLDREWLRGLRRATKQRDMRLGVHGYIGRPHPKPAAEAKALAKEACLFHLRICQVEVRPPRLTVLCDFPSAGDRVAVLGERARESLREGFPLSP